MYQPTEEHVSLISFYADGNTTEAEALSAGVRALLKEGVDSERISEVLMLRDALKNELADEVVIGLSSVHKFSQTFINGSTDSEEVGDAYRKLIAAYDEHCEASDQDGLDRNNHDTAVILAIQIAERGQLSELESVVRILAGSQGTHEARQEEEQARNLGERQAVQSESAGTNSRSLGQYRGPAGREVQDAQLVALDLTLDQFQEICVRGSAEVSTETAANLEYMREEWGLRPSGVLNMLIAGEDQSTSLDDVANLMLAVRELSEGAGLESSEGEAFLIVESVKLESLSRREQEILLGDSKAVETNVLAAFARQFGFNAHGLQDDATDLADAMFRVYEVMGKDFLNDALKEALKVARDHRFSDLEQVLELAGDDFAAGNAQVAPNIVDFGPSYDDDHSPSGAEDQEEEVSADSDEEVVREEKQPQRSSDDDNDVMIID